ncbi:fibrillarin-like rRNA methylase [groundwater metagenome]
MVSIKVGNVEYRIWDPYHSKLAALLIKGASIPLKKESTVLYLGAANGTTVSQVSDIVSDGVVFAVEFSPSAMKDLIRTSTPRMNFIPILEIKETINLEPFHSDHSAVMAKYY